MDSGGKRTHLSKLFTMSMESAYNGGGRDILGDTAYSAKDIGQTSNLFHVDALNKSGNSNTQEKKETQGINILPRKDVATISLMGKASSALQNLMNQIEVNQEGIKE